MKKALFALAAVVVAASLSSCASGGGAINVINYKTKDPVRSASITAVNGNYSSEPVYTDSDGNATAPTLPMGAKHLVIKKSGYSTQTVKISP